MKPRVLVGSVVVIAALVGVWLMTRSTDEPASTNVPGSTASSPTSSSRAPSLPPNGSAQAPATAGSGFEQVRREAIARFEGDVTTNVQMCSAQAGSSAPQPRDVRLVLEWNPGLSTADFQTLVVKELSIVDSGGLSTASRDCIRRATGMQLRFPVTADQLPRDARLFDHVIRLSVP